MANRNVGEVVKRDDERYQELVRRIEVLERLLVVYVTYEGQWGSRALDWLIRRVTPEDELEALE